MRITKEYILYPLSYILCGDHKGYRIEENVKERSRKELGGPCVHIHLLQVSSGLVTKSHFTQVFSLIFLVVSSPSYITLTWCLI